jgi:hypothetical protein
MRRENNMGAWPEPIDAEPQVKLEEEKMVLEKTTHIRVKGVGNPPRPTMDERRFLEACRSLGEKPNRKDHYRLLGMYVNSSFYFISRIYFVKAFLELLLNKKNSAHAFRSKCCLIRRHLVMYHAKFRVQPFEEE